MRAALYLLIALLLSAAPALAAPRKALFDNTHAETAGNADWVIDDQQPLPSPDPSTVGPATARTVWTGAISSWGIDLVKRGYQVATLTSAYGISYGNPNNAYDLSKYDVFIVDEPNTRFTAAESTAIFAFVRDGGGLVMVVDHYQSDRNNDGWDSPMIWNALDAQRLFGVRAGVNGDANNNIVQTSTNVNASAADSVTRGPVGNVTGLAFHNGTTFTLYPASNPAVRGEVWMNGLPQTSTTGVMAASSVYGNGRLVIVGDSSPADDGSANSGNSNIYDGWGEAGATDSTFFMNATMWATRRDAPPASWTITASAGAGGSITPAGAVSVAAGASQDFTIAPVLGYHVADVRVDGASVGVVTSYTFTNVTADHTIAASFGIESYPLTVVIVGAGEVAKSPDLPAYPYGSSVQLTAAPGPGWDFAGWSGDTSATANPLTLPITGNRVVQAAFRDVAPPVVQVLSPSGGEEWARGSVQSITWSAADNAGVDSVDVDYSLGGAAGPWHVVAHGLANSGTCSWTLPGESSDSALVRVTAYDHALNSAGAVSDSLFRIADPTAGVGDGAPRALALARPQPNPSRAEALLRFTLPAAGRARLEVADLAGRRVWGAAGDFGAGSHALRWDGTTESGGRAGAGLYFVRLTTPWGSRTERLVRLR